MQHGRTDLERSTGFAAGIYTKARDGAARAGRKDFHAHGHLYFVERDCPRVEAPFGMTLLQAALHHRVEGILGECGGNGMCATCHVYVDSAYLSRIPPAKENEKFMLSIAAEGPAANSRLCCQIRMTEELDGIMVRVPGKQK